MLQWVHQFLLGGERLDDVLLQAGDYQLAPAGTGHTITETDTGVVIYDELTVTVEEVPTPTTAIMTDDSYFGDTNQGTWTLSGA